MGNFSFILLEFFTQNWYKSNHNKIKYSTRVTQL